MRFKTYNTGFDEEMLQKILNHVRGTIAHLAGEAASDSLSEKEVEDILAELMSTMSERDISNCLHGLCPKSLRELIKMSKVATKDLAEITFEFDSTKKKNKCIKKPSSETRYWLFPYDFRKISDLPDNDLVSVVHDFTDYLPKENSLWYKFMKHLKPILNPYEMNDLQERVLSLPNPYSKIVEQFSKNGGTLGGLLKAAEELKKTPDLLEADVKRINEYMQKVEDIRTNAFDSLLDQTYCPSTIPHVKSMQEFEELVSRSQRLKTAVMKRFTAIQDTLEQGDQLWIFHQRWFMKSYAHVVIIGSGRKLIHVSAPDVKLKELLQVLQKMTISALLSDPKVKAKQQYSDGEQKRVWDSDSTTTLPRPTVKLLPMLCMACGQRDSRQVFTWFINWAKSFYSRLPKD